MGRCLLFFMKDAEGLRTCCCCCCSFCCCCDCCCSNIPRAQSQDVTIMLRVKECSCQGRNCLEMRTSTITAYVGRSLPVVVTIVFASVCMLLWSWAHQSDVDTGASCLRLIWVLQNKVHRGQDTGNVPLNHHEKSGESCRLKCSMHDTYTDKLAATLIVMVLQSFLSGMGVPSETKGCRLLSIYGSKGWACKLWQTARELCRQRACI